MNFFKPRRIPINLLISLLLSGLWLSIVSVSWAGPSVFRWQSLQPYLADSAMRPIQQALQQKQCAVAETHYQRKRAAMKQATSRATRLLLGRCWSQRRQWSKARKMMQPFARRTYKLWDYVLVWLGDTYKEEKKLQQAVKAYLRVPASSILYGETRLRAATLLLDAGQPAQALQSVQNMPTYARQPSHWWLAVRAARALNTPQGRQQATYWATQIWVKAPISDEARQVRSWRKRRWVHIKLSDTQRIARAFKLNRHFFYKAALRTLRRVRLPRKTPRSQRCRLHFARGFAYFRLRIYRSATPHLLRAKRVCRGSKRLYVRLLFYLGLSYQRWGRWRQGIPHFRELARRFSSHYLADDAIFRIADSADRSGRKKEAQGYYRELMRRFPRGDMSRVASWRLAYQAYRYAKWNKAKRLLGRIYKNSPRSKYAPAALYYATKAQAMLDRRNRGNQARVLHMYQKLVQSYPLHYYSFLALSQLRRITRKRWRLRRCRWKQSKGRLRCVERPVKAKDSFRKLPWGPIPEQPPTSQQLVQLYDGSTAPFLKHASYLRGRELYRLGLLDEAAAEWSRLRSCRILRPTSKYRYCGKRGDPGAALLALLFHQAGNYYLANIVFRGRGILAGRLPLRRSTLRTWYLAYPRPFWPIAKRAAQRDKVRWPVAYAIMREESAFQPSVKSPSTAYGLMQLMIFTAHAEAKSLQWKRKVQPDDLYLPKHNISLGIHHLRRLSRTFKGQLPLIAGAYNAGAHRVRRWLRRYGRFPYDKWVEAIGIKQTRHYVRRVSQSYAIYNLLYSPQHQPFWDHIPFSPHQPPM